jgi:hypothetical protein
MATIQVLTAATARAVQYTPMTFPRRFTRTRTLCLLILFSILTTATGRASVLRAEGVYPLHDLTASGINQDWDILEPNRNRHGDACMDHHFGMIDIDWSQADPRVSLRIQDITGRARVRKSVLLSELKFP